MTRRALIAPLALALSLAACTPEVCEVENLPFLGQPSTPQELFQLAQYAAKNDCCGSLYGALSERTQDEHSETKFCLFWESIALPEPFEKYKVAQVVRDGEFLAVLPDDKGRQFMFVHYQQPGEASLDAQLYIVMEKDETGKELPKLALQEQVDSQSAPDRRDRMPFAQTPAK